MKDAKDAKYERAKYPECGAQCVQSDTQQLPESGQICEYVSVSLHALQALEMDVQGQDGWSQDGPSPLCLKESFSEKCCITA